MNLDPLLERLARYHAATGLGRSTISLKVFGRPGTWARLAADRSASVRLPTFIAASERLAALERASGLQIEEVA